MTREQAIEKVVEEFDRASKMWPGWPSDPVHAAAVVVEEAGELMQDALDLCYGKKNEAHMANEAAQVAASAIRFLMSVGRYEQTPAKNHKQE